MKHVCILNRLLGLLDQSEVSVSIAYSMRILASNNNVPILFPAFLNILTDDNPNHWRRLYKFTYFCGVFVFESSYKFYFSLLCYISILLYSWLCWDILYRCMFVLLLFFWVLSGFSVCCFTTQAFIHPNRLSIGIAQLLLHFHLRYGALLVLIFLFIALWRLRFFNCRVLTVCTSFFIIVLLLIVLTVQTLSSLKFFPRKTLWLTTSLQSVQWFCLVH